MCIRDSCHPWQICDGKIALIHNGILPIQPQEGLSDTGTFARLVLEPLLRKLPLESPALAFLVERAIGSGNKIALLRNDGAHRIWCEDSGHWASGVWYSNHGYAARSRPYEDWIPVHDERNGEQTECCAGCGSPTARWRWHRSQWLCADCVTFTSR